jgi:ribosome modulation factor
MFYQKKSKPTITIHLAPVRCEMPNFPVNQSKPHRLGFKAGYHGKSSKNCPYSLGQRSRIEWLNGLIAGKYEWTAQTCNKPQATWN